METRQLRHFVAVAKHRNFTLAAKQIPIAQPALSISIKKFENQLGVMLFRRDDKTVELTHEGQVLLEHAERILQQIDDAQLAVNELKGLIKGEVRLGTPSMMGSYFFPEVIMAFKKTFPNLKMSVIEAGTQTIRKMLLAGELDIGVILDKDVPDDLETDLLITSPMVAAVGVNHSLAKKNSVDFETFFEHELVMFKPGYFHREFIDEVCLRESLTPNISYETNLLPMILQIVKHERAITALLKLVTDSEKEVVAVPFVPEVNLSLALAWRKHGYLSYADKTFIEFIKSYV
ncbi:LysR family transcriptional regulator [Vibrio sp.]|nr:LysR family transcriptional regulator [Vibrio sp.]